MSKIITNMLGIILATVIILLATLVVISQGSMVELADMILKDQSASYVSIMKSDCEALDEEAEYLYDRICSDELLEGALSSNDAAKAEEIYFKYASDESSFAAFFGADGSVFWQTENYPSSIDRKSIVNGFNSDAETLYYGYTAELDGKGSLVVGYNLRAYEYLDPIREKTGGQFTVYKGNIGYATTIIGDDGKRFEGTEMPEEVVEVVLNRGETYIGKTQINGENFMSCFEPILGSDGKVVGALYGGYATAAVDAIRVQEVMKMSLGGLLLAVIVAGISAFVCNVVIKRKILNPVKEIGKMTNEMASGNLSYEVGNIKRGKDEVGQLITAVDHMKQMLSAYISDISRVMKSMSEGDFTARPEVEYEGDFVELSKSAQLISVQMKETIAKIDNASDEVYSGASQSAQGSDSLADGTTRQAAAIEELSASLNMISKDVNDTAENAKNALGLSEGAADVLEEQREYMAQMLDSMHKIARHSAEIENIINAIDEIAFQTNILALNAAVEAARAGEAGKGFAVVADEVRNLASKAAEAVKSTSQLITAAVGAINEGEKVADMNAQSLTKVVNIFADTKVLVKDISSSADNQSASIAQITNGINEISDVVQRNSATAQEIAASCQELNARAAELKDDVSRFVI